MGAETSSTAAKPPQRNGMSEYSDDHSDLILELRAKLAAAEKEIPALRAQRDQMGAALGALRAAVRKAPHDWLCAAVSVVEGKFPVARGMPPQTVRPRTPPDDSLCSCWKHLALASGAPSGPGDRVAVLEQQLSTTTIGLAPSQLRLIALTGDLAETRAALSSAAVALNIAVGWLVGLGRPNEAEQMREWHRQAITTRPGPGDRAEKEGYGAIDYDRGYANGYRVGLADGRAEWSYGGINLAFAEPFRTPTGPTVAILADAHSAECGGQPAGSGCICGVGL